MRISVSDHIQIYNQPAISLNSKTVAANVLDFRPIALTNIEEIKKFVKYNTYRTCDFTLGGIFMWIDYFNYEYCVKEDTLFIKGISENHPGMVAFSLPLGQLSLQESLGMIMEYCERHNIRPTFSAIPTSLALKIAKMTSGRIEKLEGWSDYLYDASALATLQGKAYSKKRNHVNRFMADNPHNSFEMISLQNMDDAKDFLDKVDLSEKVDRVTAAYELVQSKDVIENINHYGFEGAILRNESGAVCGVTVGEVVGDTLYVHIEKMDHEVAGAGETINKMFAAEMIKQYPEIRFINREEDMSDPGLRYAKESYKPVALLDKCNVII